MPLDFPASPITGAIYTGPNNVIWAWDGAKWVNGTQIGTAYAPIQSPVFTGNPTAPNPPSGDADTSVATTAFVTASTAAALNNVGRNLIHNPLFNVAQRGAGPFTIPAYTADRWAMTFGGGSMSVSIGAMTDAYRTAVGDEAAKSYLAATFTGGAGAGDVAELYQCIEDTRRLSGKTITVSFWAIASTALKLGVGLYQTFGTGGSPSAGVFVNATQVSLTAGWARYTVTLSVPSAAGKTFGTTAGTDFTMLLFWLSSGATNNAAAGNIGVQSGVISIWGVQLEVGSVATPLEKPDPQQDLAKCQRFYQTGVMQHYSYNAATGNFSISSSMVMPMRATPTATFGVQNNANCTITAVGALGSQQVNMYGNVTATGQFQAQASYTISADL